MISFFTGGRRSVWPFCTWSSCASAWMCTSVLLRWVQVRRIGYARDPYVGFNKAQYALHSFYSFPRLSSTGYLHLTQFSTDFSIKLEDSSLRLSENRFFLIAFASLIAYCIRIRGQVVKALSLSSFLSIKVHFRY